jgi:3-methyladenine DNA glycosylase AlkD
MQESAPGGLAAQVRDTLAKLERLGSARVREQMATRYAIRVKKSWGIPMGAMQKVAKGLGRNHALALALWDTGWYEARTVAAYVDDPALNRGSHLRTRAQYRS